MIIGDFEQLGVNIDPIYAQNLILKNFTDMQKIYSYTVTQKNLQLLKKSTVTPEKNPIVIFNHK